jgi:hypothetical protein
MGAVSKEVTAVRLALPSHWRVHPVFHVSAVKPYPVNTRETLAPPPVMVEGYEEYHVETILSHEFTGRNRDKIRYLVKWLGQGTEENQWVKEDDLTSDGKYENQAIIDYWERCAAESSTLLARAPVQTAKPMKSKKYRPKAKLAKPTEAKAKRKSDLPPSAEPRAKRRRYPKRGVVGGQVNFQAAVRIIMPTTSKLGLALPGVA